MAKAKKKTPEGLDGLWDEDTETAWRKLNPRQQKFLQAYLTNGNAGSEAYRTAYKCLSNDSTVAVMASNLLRTVNIAPFLEKLADTNKADFLLAKKVYREGMNAFKPVWNPEGDSALDIPDHMTRKANADSIMKLNGEYVEKSKIDITTTEKITDLSGLSTEDLETIAALQAKMK